MALVALHLIVQTEDEHGQRTTVYDEAHLPVCDLCGASLDEGGTIAAVLVSDPRRTPGLVFNCQRHHDNGQERGRGDGEMGGAAAPP